MRTRNLLWMISIIAFIILGNSLAVNAVQYQDINEEITPDLFHIGTVYIDITVSETEFTPAEFTVKESATVNITIESLDVDHTFYIPEYDINVSITALATETVEFEADKLGSFTYSSLNCSETGTMIVEDPYVPDMPRPEEINIFFDFRHNSNATYTNLKYSDIGNWTTVDNDFEVRVNYDQFITADGLLGADVLIILEPDVDFTDDEILVIQDYLENGGSLIIGGSFDTADTNVYEFTRPFGFEFSNATARFINTTDLSDPIGENNTLDEFLLTDLLDHPITTENQYVPLTDDTVSKLKYTGTLLDFNESWIEESVVKTNLTDDVIIIDSYVFAHGNESIFADVDHDITVGVNETIGVNNTFIVASENSRNGRVIGIGSADIFNNSMIGRYSHNEAFFQRVLQWATKMYAVIQSSDYQLSTLSLNRGEEIQANLSITAQNNSVIASINVTLNVWRTDKIEQTLYLTAVNNSFFDGTIDTERFLRTLTIEDNNLAITRKGIGVVESILMARTLMYSSVYFHKTVRIAELMLSKAIEFYKDSDPFELYKMTDSELINELQKMGKYQKEIGIRLKYRNLFKQAYTKSKPDLNSEQIKSIKKLENNKKRREKEIEFESKLNIPKGHIIIDIPYKELHLSEPRINQTESIIVDGNKIRSFDEFSTIGTAVKERSIPEWDIMIMTDEKYRSLVSQNSEEILFN